MQLRVAGKEKRKVVLAGESLNCDCPLMPERRESEVKGGGAGLQRKTLRVHFAT